MTRILIGTTLSALVLMAWGFVYWVVLWGPGAQFKALPDEAGMMAEFRGRLESGVYQFPFQPGQQAGHGEAQRLFEERHRQGPLGLLMVVQPGREAMGWWQLTMGLAGFLASSLVAGILLWLALPVLGGYLTRVTFVTSLGIFAALSTRLADPVWWNLPWAHHLHLALMTLINSLLAGLVLGAVIHPRRGFTHETDPSRPLWKRAMDEN